MPKVVILGGGVAGLSAAHELINRGFEVEVYEKNPVYYGGKARSIDYTHEGTYTKPLPGEHGFRFFPGFYKHVTATMKEIPFTENGKTTTVYDNLVPTSRIMIARYGMPPIVTPASFPRNLSDIELLLKDMHGVDSGLSKEEIEFFAARVWQLMTSCSERFDNDYERIGWWQYTQASRFSYAYQTLLVEGLTRTLVAAQAEIASTKTGGSIFLQLLYCMTDPAVNTDRVLNGPTNDRWLYPWMDYLRSKNVKFTHGVRAIAVNMNKDNTAIASATIRQKDKTEFEVTGDYYLMCMPVERAAPLISPAMINVDKSLAYIQTLAPSVAWMNGIQFYLNKNVVINKGHVICCDTEWALTCISQLQFWGNYNIADKGNGQVRDVLSVDISDWTANGKFTTTKPANECTRAEVEKEVWAQLKASLNYNSTVISDDMLVDYYLDRDIREKTTAQMTAEQLKDTEPLLVNSVNTWSLRPDADCGIPNLFFASDYVRTNTDLATMEGANEAARRAVNCIIDTSGVKAEDCKIWELNNPFCFSLLQWYDKQRWKKGLPWTMKSPWWMKVLTFLLGIVYMIYGFIQSIIHRIGVSSESAFIVFSMVLTLGFALLDAWLDWGYITAWLLAFGMFGMLSLYAIVRKDNFLKKLLLFGTAAGFTELIADNWLVNGIHSLVYPAAEAKLWASPTYMPFAWAVILVQVGYLGYLVTKKHSMLTAFIITFLIGMCFIPVFECCAKYAGWWYYVPGQKMFANTPYYIILGEGLICFILPFLYKREWTIGTTGTLISGVLQGLWIFAAYYISYQLLM